MAEQQSVTAADAAREARREVIARYARMRRDQVVFCKPSLYEAGTRDRVPRSDRKIIFDSRAKAEACARDLETVGCDPLRAYLCPRSRGGLTHDGTRTTRRVP